jgi:hypothetical protein
MKIQSMLHIKLLSIELRRKALWLKRKKTLRDMKKWQQKVEHF